MIEETFTMEKALTELGVNGQTLSHEDRRILDEQGFIVFEQVLSPAEIAELRETYEYLMNKEGTSAGLEVHQEKGTRRLADLVNKGQIFDRIYTHPKVLAAVRHVIGRPFKLSSLNARDAIPGEGLQGLHADWGKREAGEPFHVCNSIWLLDDFTPGNGATRVVPGTHKLGGGPSDYLADTASPHPEEVLIVAPAGSVCVFNSHVWHGGTLNRTSDTRRAMHAYYTAREHPQQLDQKAYIQQATLGRISRAARYILDV